MAVTYFGNEDDTDHIGGSVGNTTIIGSRHYNTVAGNITEMGVWQDDYDGVITIRLGVYADTGSETQPGDLVADAGTVETASGQNNTFRNLTGLSIAVTANTWYWLAFVQSGTFYTAKSAADSGEERVYADQVYGALPASFPAANHENYAHLIRAGVELSATATNVVLNII